MGPAELATRLSYCPVCRTQQVGIYLAGPGGRPDASCPHCMSLERERFLALLLDCLAPLLSRPAVLLDIAPSDRLTPLLQKLTPKMRIGLDFDPSADGRLVDIQASVTDLPLDTDSVDVMVCYHVLEHVPDDRAAMREIARALRPGGVAIIQVPWRSSQPTDEDPSADVDERRRRFGQADHVRFYGTDFESRLTGEGLDVHRVTPGLLLGPDNCSWFRVKEHEAVWLCTPAGHGMSGTLREALTTGSLSEALSWMRSEVERLRTVTAELDKLRARTDELDRRRAAAAKEVDRLRAAKNELDQMWRSRYRTLDRHPVLRIYRRLRRPAVKVRARFLAWSGRAGSASSRTRNDEQLR